MKRSNKAKRNNYKRDRGREKKSKARKSKQYHYCNKTLIGWYQYKMRPLYDEIQKKQSWLFFQGIIIRMSYCKVIIHIKQTLIIFMRQGIQKN